MYHFKGSLTVGQINRFVVEIDSDALPENVEGETLAIRIKNTSSFVMRPALLAGPYIIYMSIREQSYRHDTALGKGDFPPHFDANVKTNCSRWQCIPITPPQDKDIKVRCFEVDILSQIVFSPSATVYYEMTIGRDKKEVRSCAKLGKPVDATTPGFKVRMQDTESIWHMPPVPRDHPGHHIADKLQSAADRVIQVDADGNTYDHLVVLTHGIHSNLTTDMLYLKEAIERTARKRGERVVCKGYAGNTCNTERGVKWLAENVAEWVLRETGWICNNSHAVRAANPYKKISFIAHSLGGLVQIYALGYLHDKTRGRIFVPEKGGLEPINFITLATPWLGISAENPAYVKLALDFGIVGKTGQDLALTLKPLGEYTLHNTGDASQPRKLRSKAPLLSILSRPSSPAHIAIKLFSSRTVYANIENDGIVPLRTSSLYFLDWEGFSVEKAKIQKKLQSRRATENSEESQNDTAVEQSASEDIYGMHGQDLGGPKGDSERSSSFNVDRFTRPRSSNPDDYSSSDESDSESSANQIVPALAAENASDDELARDLHRSQLDELSVPPKSSGYSTTDLDSTDEPHSDARDAAAKPKITRKQSRVESPVYTAETNSTAGAQEHKSTFRSVAHALNFASLMRRVSAGRVPSSSTDGGETRKDQDTDEEVRDEDQTPTQTPHATNEAQSSAPLSSKSLASGPSDDTENASHANGGLLGLLKPSQTHRKPSKAFTRSQTVPKEHSDSTEQVHPEEPSRTGFFRSLESVLNPPMPALDYITDPSLREPEEMVIVHDKFYHPSDIPPLKEITTRKVVPQTNQSRSAKKAEEKERVRLEKVKLEEKIARGWHNDMTWRKILVKLQPDAHNNIIVRRAFANSFGWPVIDHLTEHHFGASAKENIEHGQRQDSQHQGADHASEGNPQKWDRDYLSLSQSSDIEDDISFDKSGVSDP